MALFDSEKKAKDKEHYTIKSIEEWVMCFNTIMAKRQPDRVQVLLAYSS